MVAPPRRRFSHAGTYRKCHSIDASRLSSAYPIDERFYFIESDGEEADDEFDQITVSADVENRGQHSHLSLPQRVSIKKRTISNMESHTKSHPIPSTSIGSRWQTME